MEKIKLYNRDGNNLWLEKTVDSYWKLRSDESTSLLGVQISFESDGSIYSVDPSGGPYLAVGTVLEGYRITEIETDGFTFKLMKING